MGLRPTTPVYEPAKYLNDGCGCESSPDRVFVVVKKRQLKDGTWVLTVYDMHRESKRAHPHVASPATLEAEVAEREARRKKRAGA